MNPRELIEKAQAGDKESYEQLYQLYLLPVYRYILLRLGEPKAAEDVCQQVFLKVWLNIGRFRLTLSDPLAYFFTVARNTLIDHLRKNISLSLDQLAETGYAPGHTPDLGAEVDAKDTRAKLLKALSKLKPEYREVINLRFFGGLSSEQAGKVLRKSPEAVRQMQHRAISQLKNELT